LIIEIEKLN